MNKIVHTLDIRAERVTVYRALLTTEGLSGWWAAGVRAEEEPGGKVDFRFEGEFNPVMEITHLEVGRAVHWKCIGGHDNWQDATFRFLLREHDKMTRLLFTQQYSRELDDEVFGIYNFNWGYYLESLRLYCETGAGKPYRPK